MSELTNAIKQICEEKGLSYEAVIATIESALAAAYRKDFGKKNQNIKVEFDADTAKSKVFDVKEVVEDLPEELADDEVTGGEEINTKAREDSQKDSTKEKKPAKSETHGEKDQSEAVGKEKKKSKEADLVEAKIEEEEEEKKFNPKTQMQISDARMIKKTVKIGEELRIKLEVPDEYGRMAAQTAKQVIIQRLREAEREMVFNDFKEKEHEVVSGVVQRREGKIVLVDLGRAVGVLTPDEMIQGEKYNPGDRIKVYVKEVSSKAKGPEILLSRTSDEILKKVFYLEIPEISNGLIELKHVAREAGFRSKVAVWTDSDNVDPIGSCVGQRGARIQTVINELGGEKVDIIAWDEDTVKFISNALSPAKILSIETHEKENKAVVKVAEDQLSLAIGKGGQNARLAAKLTGWRIDIVQAGLDKKDDKDKKPEDKEEGKGKKKEDKKEDKKKTEDKKDESAKKTIDKKDDEDKEKYEKKEDDKKKKKDNKKEHKTSAADTPPSFQVKDSKLDDKKKKEDEKDESVKKEVDVREDKSSKPDVSPSVQLEDSKTEGATGDKKKDKKSEDKKKVEEKDKPVKTEDENK